MIRRIPAIESNISPSECNLIGGDEANAQREGPPTFWNPRKWMAPFHLTPLAQGIGRMLLVGSTEQPCLRRRRYVDAVTTKPPGDGFGAVLIQVEADRLWHWPCVP